MISVEQGTRHYPVEGLDFRGFWDICQSLQRLHGGLAHVSYTLESELGLIAEEEDDVYAVLRMLPGVGDRITSFIGHFFRSKREKDNPSASPAFELIYNLETSEERTSGLHFYHGQMRKIDLYAFEELIRDNYLPDNQGVEINIEFGKPCEIVVADVDMRGFSSFSEMPNIESPYLCGLMSTFYKTVEEGFRRYPPDVLKFGGDGVLGIWETTFEDRKLTIDSCIDGLLGLDTRWQAIRKSPHFSHGAPDQIGAGISFGLGSRLTVKNDFIGRPINIASRLCNICPGGRIYIDRNLPDIREDLPKTDLRVNIKSYGEYKIWVMRSD